MNTETFDTFSEPFDIFELHRTEDIEALRSNLNVTHLHLLTMQTTSEKSLSKWMMKPTVCL